MAIPPHARKVFQGEIFSVYQWEQELFDGTSATFEMVQRPDTVQVIPIIDNKIIICDEEQPGQMRHASFLGGRVEIDEDTLAAAKRELLEETWMTAKTWKHLASYTPHTKIDWTIHYFVAHDCEKIQDPQLEAGERISLRAISFEEFVQVVSAPSLGGRELTQDILLAQLEGTIQEFKTRFFQK